MLWLSNNALAALRDKLRTRGKRPVSDSPHSVASPEQLATLEAAQALQPLCDAMYLMMSADGAVGDDEREVLRGALRNLSEDALLLSHIDAMIGRSEGFIAENGRENTLKEVAEAIGDDRARAEVAFVLAAAIAFADGVIADDENETINAFAEALGLSEEDANGLLDSLERGEAG
jgi:tellurite resistance protein